ncbi:hypothetical protein IWQ60_003752 [Tieghemiomyces parasiticus]|uniref:Uncharacterized protein n=1 Tax=Tieghemiomyces parasiticus TaxID=78921 RepID=A0A9W8DZY3_9FUNG|nr:hypothetical protein IWQ60_003752 [Tieghemiomyces parasiticus]
MKFTALLLVLATAVVATQFARDVPADPNGNGPSNDAPVAPADNPQLAMPADASLQADGSYYEPVANQTSDLSAPGKASSADGGKLAAIGPEYDPKTGNPGLSGPESGDPSGTSAGLPAGAVKDAAYNAQESTYGGGKGSDYGGQGAGSGGKGADDDGNGLGSGRQGAGYGGGGYRDGKGSDGVRFGLGGQSPATPYMVVPLFSRGFTADYAPHPAYHFGKRAIPELTHRGLRGGLGLNYGPNYGRIGYGIRPVLGHDRYIHKHNLKNQRFNYGNAKAKNFNYINRKLYV